MNERLIMLFVVYAFSINSAHSLKNVTSSMRIAVIGAGVGGLSSLRHLIKDIPDADIVAFDLNGEVGGTWIYNEKIREDEFGIPLTSSMYKNLRTNLPKVVMSFSDFPMPDYYKSFLNRTEVLQYLHNYSTTFNLDKYIKFRHLVTSVKYLNEKWIVVYQNLITKEEYSEIFDYIIVANGHNSKKFTPKYKGLSTFKGSKIHSHDYKTPDRYANKTVLVIGSGPSGIDISIGVAEVSKKLIISHHYKKGKLKSPFPPNYIQKPDVIEFTENSVIFKDGTEETIDDIIFCTGFVYHCPFLDSSSKIDVRKTFVYPLYRHIVNINHPTMFFIGIPQRCCVIPLIDIQTRYVIAAISGKFKLPSKQKMSEQLHYNDNKSNKHGRRGNCIPSHKLDARESTYFAELAEEAGIESVPPVFCAIKYSILETIKNMYTYRNYNYEIIDDEHYLRIYNEGTDEETREIIGSEKCEAVVKII